MNQTNLKWDYLINLFLCIGKKQTKERKHNELKMPRWDRLKQLEIAQTSGCDFLDLLNKGGVQTRQYLRCLQGSALEMGVITHPILPNKMWPPKVKEEKRSITLEEHRLLHSNLRSWRWKIFLTLLWETGAAQSDAAHFRLENLKGDVLEYHRMKTGARAAQRLSPELVALVHNAACGRKKGFIIPSLQRMDQKDRANIFRRACLRCGVEGVSLHSYRYGWAERAYEAEMPERLAMIALGHNSKAIHRAYSKKATVVAPSIEQYRAMSSSIA